MKACKFKDLVVGDEFTINEIVATRINTRETTLTKNGLANAQDRVTGSVFYVDHTALVFKTVPLISAEAALLASFDIVTSNYLAAHSRRPQYAASIGIHKCICDNCRNARLIIDEYRATIGQAENLKAGGK